MSKSDLEKIGSLLLAISNKGRSILQICQLLPNWPERDAVEESSIRLLALCAEASSHVLKVQERDVAAMQNELDNIVLRTRTGSLSARVNFEGDRREAYALLEENTLSIKNLLAGIRLGLFNISQGDFRDLIPNQKSASYQFQFVDGFLVVKNQEPPTLGAHTAIAESAFQFLVEQSSQVWDDIAVSNCPPRLKRTLQHHRKLLLSRENIVGLGMSNQDLTRMVKASVEELSQSQFAMLGSHAAAVFDYLAQFPDWREFCENALSTRMSSEDVDQLASMARTLAEYLDAHPGLTGPSVASALTEVAKDVSIANEPDQRKALNLARTLENFVSAVSRGLTAVKNEVLSLLKKRIAKGILALLMSLALHVLELVPGAEWVSTVVAKAIQGDVAKE